MPRNLPARPHLDHLRKQAKALLAAMQQSNPNAILSDAQHAVARDYGFASWPKLKAHIEEAASGSQGSGPGGRDGGTPIAESPEPPPRPMFARFTMQARQALFFSRSEASRRGRLGIAPEHVLLGIIQAGRDGPLRRVFVEGTVTLDEARTALDAADAALAPVVEPIEIPFQPTAKEGFLAAAQEADALGHEHIGVLHLLLGLLRQPSGFVESFLRNKRIRAEAVRQAARGAVDDELI